MSETSMNSSESSNYWLDYLKARDREERKKNLTLMSEQKSQFPICLAEDLLLLDLDFDEKSTILRLTDSKDPCALEHFLTRYLLDWGQDLAALAIRNWSDRTDHVLWFRLVALAAKNQLSQRVLFTLVDCADAAGGSLLIETVAGTEGIQNLSSAFFDLLLLRSIQWSTPHPSFDAIAQRILIELRKHTHFEHKAIPAAIAYLLRFHPTEAPSQLKMMPQSSWLEIFKALLSHSSRTYSQLNKLAKRESKEDLSKGWPALHDRALIPESIITRYFMQIFGDENRAEQTISWRDFAGIPQDKLMSSLKELDDPKVYLRSANTVYPLLHYHQIQEIREHIKTIFDDNGDLAFNFVKIAPRLKKSLGLDQPLSLRQQELFEEELLTIRSLQNKDFSLPIPQTDLSDHPLAHQAKDVYDSNHPARKAFFHRVYRDPAQSEATLQTPEDQGFWELLFAAWEQPQSKLLPTLAQASRPIHGLYRLCYITTLGRFVGEDQAALKLLDFIRTKDEDELRAVIYALSGIGTPRALQELVSTITRPNVTVSLKLEICGLLANADVTNLQSEIRSAIKDQTTFIENSDSALEVQEALTSLLKPLSSNTQTFTSTLISPQSDTQLDTSLQKKLRHYNQLSSEVKRALRTSQFFHMQVSLTDAPDAIDLSPVIDMQYKALELFFRESFEEHCSRLIQTGTLQRRLDVIGYARPIPKSMDEFEAYINDLPIIKEIPFFSSFKLRKTLRAICQFRPGRRFTLDGLKAFALFFLCFGRSQCRYNLGGILNLGFKDDSSLFEFVRTLHVMQDFRNRAAHEGFHPDASNDIDRIWRDTAFIIQTAFEIRSFLESSTASTVIISAPSSQILIEKKKAG